MTDQQHTDPTLLARCLENTFERSRRSARAVDGRLLVEGDGLLLIAAEGLPWITGATLTRVPSGPAATLARAQAFFAERGLHWGLTAAGDVAAAIAPAAAAFGLVPGERRPGMLLAPLAGEPHEVPGLEIREVRTPQALAVFNATSAAGFGGEDLFPLIYQPAVLETPDVALYVGYLDGEPVATAVRGTSYRIAGIGGVSTVPAARRRGIGEAITWRAALDGRAEGCVASFLQATAMGYGLYARMGYRHVIDFHAWDAPAGYSP
jgi:GNAT superfamily N-acetyltransferase